MYMSKDSNHFGTPVYHQSIIVCLFLMNLNFIEYKRFSIENVENEAIGTKVKRLSNLILVKAICFVNVRK